jgi:hypothetical protein
MKLRIIPLMDGPEAVTTTVSLSDLTTSTFVKLLDARKAVVIQKLASTNNENTGNIDDDASTSTSSTITTEEFASILTGLQLEYYPYFGGAAPRTVIPVQADSRPIVFTANER